ncbi:MAG: basic amino acid ABC transporter substrate-binding protein [Candidatus Saccharibacteria bacterium]
MKKFARLALIVLLILGLMAFSIGCGSTDKATTGEPDKATEKILKVGSETAYPPFEVQDKNGQYVGFDMDLIRAIGKAEGYKVEIISLPFTGLIPALKSGNIDAAISAMTITDERKKSVDFSDPYIDSGQIISMRSDDTRPITKLEDLKGLVIAVQMGTTGQDQAEKVVALDAKTQVKKFDSVDQAFLELKNKGADVCIIDQPVTLNYITKGHPEIKMVGKMFTDEKYGISVNKGNKKVLDVINSGLKKVKANGEYDKIFKKHIGG